MTGLQPKHFATSNPDDTPREGREALLVLKWLKDLLDVDSYR